MAQAHLTLGLWLKDGSATEPNLFPGKPLESNDFWGFDTDPDKTIVLCNKKSRG